MKNTGRIKISYQSIQLCTRKIYSSKWIKNERTKIYNVCNKVTDNVPIKLFGFLLGDSVFRVLVLNPRIFEYLEKVERYELFESNISNTWFKTPALSIIIKTYPRKLDSSSSVISHWSLVIPEPLASFSTTRTQHHGSTPFIRELKHLYIASRRFTESSYQMRCVLTTTFCPSR